MHNFSIDCDCRLKCATYHEYVYVQPHRVNLFHHIRARMLAVYTGLTHLCVGYQLLTVLRIECHNEHIAFALFAIVSILYVIWMK